MEYRNILNAWQFKRNPNIFKNFATFSHEPIGKLCHALFFAIVIYPKVFIIIGSYSILVETKFRRNIKNSICFLFNIEHFKWEKKYCQLPTKYLSYRVACIMYILHAICTVMIIDYITIASSPYQLHIDTYHH